MSTTFLLAWPLFINRAPFYSEDSASYLRGGRFGVDTGLLIIKHWWQSLLGTSGAVGSVSEPQQLVASAIAQSGGTRSVIYSVVTHLLQAPGQSLVFLAIAQAAAVALVVSILRRLIAPQARLVSCLVVGAGVALLTSAPWYAAYVVPDILAGVGIAGAVALTVVYERTNIVLRIALVLLIAFCITTHASHLLIILSALAAGAIANFWLHGASAAGRKALWFASPLLLAVGALLGTSYVAFGELSLAPKRYPIQLARSVADGPGAWYLRDHCASERYAICEIFGANPPRKVGEFLWGENGVRYRATPEQMERIRAEESTIVRRAAMEYPAYQLHRSVQNTLRQLVTFGTGSLVFGQRMVGRDDPSAVQAAPDRPALRQAGNVVIYISFAMSIVLLVAFRRRLCGTDVSALSVVAVGLLANAAVCGILSAVTDRYQGRVAWVLPALALMILLRGREDSSPAATKAKVALA